jgi:ADP-ribose pyrophosphatase
MAAFVSAFVALMPNLGDENGIDGTFGADGAFALPFWAMFGEFGDLHSVGVAGGRLGPCLLWIFSFTTQVVLVNLLIAMMSETYENIKQDADNEWKYSRVFVVDEFVSSVYWVPPPFSLPFLVVEMAHALSGLVYDGLKNFCVRFRDVARRCGRKGEKSRQLPSRPLASLGRMSASRATGLGYRRDASVVPLLSDTLPLAVLDTQAPDRMWLADVLEDEDREHECATETKIERLSSELSKVLDKSLEIQETLLKLQTVHEQSSRESGASALGGAPTISRSVPSMGSLPSSPRISETLTGPPPPPPPIINLSPATKAPSPRGRSFASPSARDVPMQVAGAADAPPHAAPSGPSETALPAIAESPQHAKGKAPRTLHDELAAKLEAAERALELTRNVHSVARSQQHPKYPQRFQVPDDKVDWRARFPEYSPRRFTGTGVEANTSSATNPNGWADPADPNHVREELKTRKSFEGELFFDAHGRPVNPRGRTGICDRGMLGKWGPNHAADPIVTRWKPGASAPVLQVVAIRRGDTGIWALPGGMVDAGENVSVTVRREFEEEAGNVREGAEREAFNSAVAQLFSNGRIVYQGYVDDPRNTDNAWMETTAFHFHCDEELGSKLPLRAGDDANDVTWLDVNVDEPRYVNLYASHRQWVDQVYKSMTSEGAPTPLHKAGKPKRGVFGFGFRSTQPRPVGFTPPPSPPSSPANSARRGSTHSIR